MRILLTFMFLASLLAIGCEKENVPLTENAKKVIQGNNEFAFDLYTHLRNEKEGNLFFSPFSITSALTMTGAGARGDTANEMDATLHLASQEEKTHTGFAEIKKWLNREKKDYELVVANKLWGQQKYNFQKDFLALLNKHYGAGLEEVNFSGATEKARQTINQWVEKATKEKIKELFKKGILNPYTRLVLTNAIYFKGNWARQFKKDSTRERDFYLTEKETVKVPMMAQNGKFRHAVRPDLQVLEMAYEGDELAMTIILPTKRHGLGAIEKQLTAEKLQEWTRGMAEQKVIVRMPRFKMTSEFRLDKTLQDMGMKKAFNREANFSGISTQDELYIQAVVHKAFVEVNEEGTEAAAATGVAVGKRSAPIVPVFNADHPFLFLIRDRANGNILFMGRVADPSKS